MLQHKPPVWEMYRGEDVFWEAVSELVCPAWWLVGSEQGAAFQRESSARAGRRAAPYGGYVNVSKFRNKSYFLLTFQFLET